MFSCAEYIWLDGAVPTKQLRSKTRILPLKKKSQVSLEDFPEWSYDGSSTKQAPGERSDLVLVPVQVVSDPIRGQGNYLVLCEVIDIEGRPVASNSRSLVRHVLSQGAKDYEPWFGFEQEYALFQGKQPFGWPANGYPLPQGPYYCGVGSDRVFGRQIVECHTQACLSAGLMLCGTNAEVLPSQWEFQIGCRNIPSETPDPLTVADHLWLARWLLHRIGEQFGLEINLDCKPVKGDWNGSGGHTNFSTKAMRDPKTGWEAIHNYVNALAQCHPEHIAVYGHGLEERLTGLHETCDINSFRFGPRDRKASVRIPHGVALNKYGYIEDRRPGSNCDPYLVCARMLETLLNQKPLSGKKSVTPKKGASLKKQKAWA